MSLYQSALMTMGTQMDSAILAGSASRNASLSLVVRTHFAFGARIDSYWTCFKQCVTLITSSNFSSLRVMRSL